MIPRLSFSPVWIALALLGMWCAAPVASALARQRVHVGSDVDQFWLVIEDTDAGRFTLMLRGPDDPADAVHLFHNYTGTIVPGGVAAADGRLWIVFSDGTVQTFRVLADPVSGQSLRDQQRMARLPRGMEHLRSLTVGHAAWALIRVADAQALAQIDAPPAPMIRRVPRAPAPGLSPADLPDDQPSPAEPQTVPTPPPPPTVQVPADRLLMLQGNRWVKVDLPEDWPHESRSSWAVMRRPDDDAPTLIAAVPAGDADELRVYQRDGQGWRKQVHNVDVSGLLQPLAVEGQLILVRQRSTPGRVEVALSVLRPQTISPIGALGLDMAEGSSFALASWLENVALVARDQESNTLWTQMNLLGKVTLPATDLRESQVPIVDQMVQYLLVLGPLAVLLLLIVAVWRRDPRRNAVALPENLRIAQLTQRVMAASIDCLPALVIAAFVHDVPLFQIVQNWPWMMGGSDLEHVYPALTTIGLFVLTTLPFELFTARTPGKMIFGLRVTDLHGQPPRFWPIVARNVFKAFDLVAVVLLLLPLLGPFRQRLGDLIARTVVVVRAEEKKPNEDDKIND